MRFMMLILMLSCAAHAQLGSFNLGGLATRKQASGSAPATPIVLGYTNAGSGNVASGRQNYSGPYVLSTAGTATKMRIYCAGAVTVSAAIYGPNGDNTRPGSLIATNSATASGSASAGWVEVPFNTSIPTGTYFLGAWGSGTMTFYRNTGATGTNSTMAASATWPGWPASYSHNSESLGTINSMNLTVQP